MKEMPGYKGQHIRRYMQKKRDIKQTKVRQQSKSSEQGWKSSPSSQEQREAQKRTRAEIPEGHNKDIPEQTTA